eukprot:g2485.t1
MAGLNPLVFLDVAVGRRAVGRLKFELFHDQLPFTSENFRCLCTGETGLGYWLRPRWYKDTNFLRVVPGFMCQGGDFNFGSMLMGESIYGQRFRDERFCYKHSKRGVLHIHCFATGVGAMDAAGFFEGTEKRIEIDFRGEGDLRHAPRSSWETVVTQSATQTPGTRRWNPVERILNCKETAEFTSFLLSESSLLVYPRKTIIKTCGSTVPLSAVPTLLKIGESQGLELEWMCYSRKNFLAPEADPHEHQSMEGEVEACKKVFGPVGDAYVLGPLTGEHWLFYDALYLKADYLERGDFTIDVMMYDLPKDVQEVFHTSEPEGSRVGAEKMTKESGLAQIAEFMNAEVDDYCFESCHGACDASGLVLLCLLRDELRLGAARGARTDVGGDAEPAHGPGDCGLSTWPPHGDSSTRSRCRAFFGLCPLCRCREPLSSTQHHISLAGQGRPFFPHFFRRSPGVLHEIGLHMWAPCPWLDGKHVVFGHVVDGMDVLDSIEAAGTEGGKTKARVWIHNSGEETQKFLRKEALQSDLFEDPAEQAQAALAAQAASMRQVERPEPLDHINEVSPVPDEDRTPIDHRGARRRSARFGRRPRPSVTTCFSARFDQSESETKSGRAASEVGGSAADPLFRLQPEKGGLGF